MSETDFEKCNYDPWHSEFHDNFAKGTGNTKELALQDLDKELKEIGEHLWM